jgi:hypothetical protein
MKGNGFLVQADYRLRMGISLLINTEYVFHFLDVLVIEFRDAPHFFPATA